MLESYLAYPLFLLCHKIHLGELVNHENSSKRWFPGSSLPLPLFRPSGNFSVDFRLNSFWTLFLPLAITALAIDLIWGIQVSAQPWPKEIFFALGVLQRRCTSR